MLYHCFERHLSLSFRAAERERPFDAFAMGSTPLMLILCGRRLSCCYINNYCSSAWFRGNYFVGLRRMSYGHSAIVLFIIFDEYTMVGSS